MGYIQNIEKLVTAKEDQDGQESDFNMLELLIEMDSTFKQAKETMIRAVKQLDQKHPEIGATEILAALMTESMKVLFPNLTIDDLE